MRNVITIDFAFELKFNGLVKMVSLRRIALLDNDFDDKLPFKHFVGDNRDISDFYLTIM
jgi:hypothetical protein